MPKSLPSISKTKIFLTVFCALNIVFAFYQTSFFIGNHDWDWVKGTTQILSLNTGLFEGRYAKFILNVLLFQGQVLPILNSIISFALLALGTTLLVDYWKLKQSSTRVLVALMPVLTPFILGWLYFPINILGNFSVFPLVVFGLQEAEKNGNKHKIIAIMLFLLALGVYPSAIEMMIICWCFRWILDTAKDKQNIARSFLPLICSLLLFKIILFALTKFGIIYSEHYNLKTADLFTLIAKIPAMLVLIIHQLYDTLPFFPRMFKIVGIMLVGSAIMLSKKSPFKLGLWGVALFSTALSAFLTANPEDVAYMPRVNFYGLNFLYTGAAAVILANHSCKIRNLGLVLCVLFLGISVNQNYDAEKVWHLGKVAEENLIKRISHRIEIKNNRPLTPVVAGEISLRPRYYAESYDHQSPYILNAPFLIRHIPSGMFNFYSPTQMFLGNSQISSLDEGLYTFLKNAALPLPSEEGLYVDDTYVIMLLTNEGIRAIQAQMPAI